MLFRVGVVALVTGCSASLEPQQAMSLEGFRYGWVAANHRVSAIQVGLDSDVARVAVVGGTSTTGVDPAALSDGCDPDGCKEFPITDSSEVVLGWARLSSDETALVRATAAMEVGAAGASGVATAAWPKGAEGTAVAWITGVHLSTDHPLSGGEACYRPEYGWHPRQLSITVGTPVADGETVEVPIDAVFAAGESLEADRACVDEVNDQAIVDLAVDVVVLAGPGEESAVAVHQEASFPWDGAGLPPEQLDPAAVGVDLGFAPTAAGFSAIDFRFHPTDPDDRGAYLRTLAFSVDVEAGTANGTATNYSPFTQLSGFDYTFDGEVRGVTYPLTAERGVIVQNIDADLDDAGAPEVNELAYE